MVAIRMWFVVRNLALDPNRAKFCLERAANGTVQFRDGEDLGSLLEEVACVCHVERQRDVASGYQREAARMKACPEGAKRVEWETSLVVL